MAKARVDVDTLEDEIARLRDLDLSDLRNRWLDLCGQPAPKFFRRKFLARAVAYQMQARAFGGLSDRTKRRLRKIAEAVRNGDDEAALAQPRIKPGTKLIRLWQDKTHTITVIEDGFVWDGKQFKSLSAAARAITGTNWNGYAFFGLKRRRKNDFAVRSKTNG